MLLAALDLVDDVAGDATGRGGFVPVIDAAAAATLEEARGGVSKVEGGATNGKEEEGGSDPEDTLVDATAEKPESPEKRTLFANGQTLLHDP